MELQITLASVAFAALINIWLAARCGKARASAKVSIGDGGDKVLCRRMRAQANFTEYTPFALLLIAALDLAGYGGYPLAGLAFAFLLGRISHGIGMEAEEGESAMPRVLGMLLTLPIMLVLAIWAFYAAFSHLI